MICDDGRMIKHSLYHVLILSLFFVAPVFSADNLYDGFKNPPMSARPVVQWRWDDNSPGEQEIISRLEAFKKAGFGGVEIFIFEDINAQTLKFAADAAKQRGMIVDLSLGSTLGGSFISSAEQGQQLSISKKKFTGPTNSVVNVNDLIKVPDPNNELVFLRLIQTDALSFSPGEELIGKIKPDGTVIIDINDANTYTLYAGILHPVTTPAGSTTLDMLNKQASEKYFNNISAKLNPLPSGKFGDSIHSIECPSFEPAVVNWTGDFPKQFLKRYGYDIIPYLPAVLDNDLPRAKTRFSDTIRRTRYDFYSALVGLYNERFTNTFKNFCRDNGALSRIPAGSVSILDSCSVPLDIFQGDVLGSGSNMRYRTWDKITSSAAHLADKSLVIGELTVSNTGNIESLKINDDIAFVAGDNQTILAGVSLHGERNPVWPYIGSWTERNMRLSYLFQNARHQARIAIFLPAADLWSDCGPSETGMADYIWYLFSLWQALSQNGYTVDFISDKIVSQANIDDGKLHFGSQTYEAVIVPDVFSIEEFLAVRNLRFFGVNGGKIAFIGREPMTGAGFKDLFQRSVAVGITTDHIKAIDPNRVLFIPAPDKDKDNLLSWTSDMMKKSGILPTVRISPSSDKLLFVHYLDEGRDIFFFTNTDNAAPVSFRADFDTAGKTPWVWNPDTGKRDKFTHSDKSGALNISIKPGDSLLLVFEPDTKTKPAKPKIN
jgi:alpha-L-rhamnosidase